ncbi:hypothetical protein DSO57_1030574 [Entomophthora muscae]|uniref:Uncharacterized protein n=1 Tax=Entomophthora muscae TaxID=34485 RepID=A0ACC2RFM6_9FUNG|nr:hypothetical protein DSO57_1030574 [Entomophthora muscae]
MSNCPIGSVAAETTSAQLYGGLYIVLAGLVDSMMPNSRPCSLLGQSLSYAIKLAPILQQAYPLAQQYPVPGHPMPLPTPGFLQQSPGSYSNHPLDTASSECQLSGKRSCQPGRLALPRHKLLE